MTLAQITSLRPAQLKDAATDLLGSGGRMQMAYAWYPEPHRLELRYTASQAGIATGVNGILAVMTAPFIPRLMQKFDARILVFFGLSWLAGMSVLRSFWTTDTDFFHRAGMDNTEVGQKGKSESSPADVARQGIDALMDGKDHVYAASAKTKLEGMLANVVPGNVKGAMHEKMAKPIGEK